MNPFPKKEVRVRFAPSPTGLLHLGSARTTLFNWLFAKQNKGKFILRIEDTDVQRSNPKFEKDIIDGLKWLGLEWDEMYRQSNRLDVYEKYLKKLLDGKKAYYCYCTKEELETERQAMLSQGMAPKYSGKCRNLKTLPSGRKPQVIRLVMPEKDVSFKDMIRGRITFNTGLMGDTVIAKSLKEPLYNFAVTVDDYEMKISHVIRGEDHIANTPKQIILQEALGFEEVKYAHLPLILSPARKKLSKRDLETSLSDYRRQGYIKEGIVNFIALLGWHPSEEEEIFSLKELTEKFDLNRVQKAGAVFNLEKLDWLNGQHIRKLKTDDLAERLKDFVPPEWFEKKELLRKSIAVEKERIKNLAGFRETAGFFFELPEYPKEILIWLKTPPEAILDNLKFLQNLLRNVAEKDFSKQYLEKEIMSHTPQRGRGELLWPLRTALSGRQSSPGPFEILDALGKEESLRRLQAAILKFQ